MNLTAENGPGSQSAKQVAEPQVTCITTCLLGRRASSGTSDQKQIQDSNSETLTSDVCIRSQYFTPEPLTYPEQISLTRILMLAGKQFSEIETFSEMQSLKKLSITHLSDIATTNEIHCKGSIIVL